MKTVGIRELKSNLSQYISLVKEGESIFITEHNRVVAEIKKPSIDQNTVPLEKALDHLEKSGKLIRSKKTKYIPLIA
jgi:antitoxin (DNA-binding transcriptional repressor) of toxin-antitoxin stability system